MEYDIKLTTEEMLPQIALIEENEFSLPMTLDMLRHLLVDDSVIFLSAVSEGKVLGYASLKYVYDEAFFNNIAVDGEYRGKGIADRLLDKLFFLSKQNGVDSISLEVRESNVPAIRLYEKKGFIIAGKIKNYYTKPKENAIIMRTFFDTGMNKQ